MTSVLNKEIFLCHKLPSNYLKKKLFNFYNLILSQYYKIIYVQENEFDLKKLKELCNCFHLFFDSENPPKGLYQNNVLRFHSHKNSYILVGSKSKLLV